jgi:hypothetical protein
VSSKCTASTGAALAVLDADRRAKRVWPTQARVNFVAVLAVPANRCFRFPLLP